MSASGRGMEYRMKVRRVGGFAAMLVSVLFAALQSAGCCGEQREVDVLVIEVAARVKAVLRRTQQGEGERAPEQIVYESLVLDIIKKKVSIDGEEAPLTKKEFEILKLLLENKGNVFSREEILSRIWKDEVYVLDRTIDVNITRLRKKIGPYGKNIVTRLGFGYCFES